MKLNYQTTGRSLKPKRSVMDEVKLSAKFIRRSMKFDFNSVAAEHDVAGLRLDIHLVCVGLFWFATIIVVAIIVAAIIANGNPFEAPDNWWGQGVMPQTS